MTRVFDEQIFDAWYKKNSDGIHEKIIDFINIDTVTPNEDRAYDFLINYLTENNFEAKLEGIHPEIRQHSYYTAHPHSQLEGNRYNVRATYTAEQPMARTTLVNSHFDVVPQTLDFPEAFQGKVSDNKIWGRGACDTKNNIIMFVEAIRFLRENNIPITRNIKLDLVIEEEIGGNGTLSAILHGAEADEVIVLEPTDLDFFRGHRGCLTFQIEVSGRSVHMGGDTSGVNAILCAYEVIKSLQSLEQTLLAEAKKDESFNCWEKPLQINIGKISGGEWSGSVPEKCIIVGDIGFLPSYSLEDAKNLIKAACANVPDPWIQQNHTICFNGLINDAYLVEGQDKLVQDFLSVLRTYGRPSDKTYGWKVSCDARHYNKILGLPVIIFGAGSLNDAHSAHEHVDIDELRNGCKILADFFSRK